MPPDGSLGSSLELYAGHAEIPCGTWAGFKLSRYLIGFTGEARFGDWIETMVYNAIGAALPTEPDGRTYYYGDYRISERPEAALLARVAVLLGHVLATDGRLPQRDLLQGPGALYVNLFVPSEVTW